MAQDSGLLTESSDLDGYSRMLRGAAQDFNATEPTPQQVQQATMNLLEDMHEEQTRLGETQRALLNILEDVEVERVKAQQANASLEVVNKELEAFCYSVSHDLRAPLRAISGFAEALAEDCEPQLDNEGKRYLGRIQDNAHRMGQLIDDLLAFSRLSRQQMTVTRIDMGGMAKAVFDELAALQPKRRISFTVGDVPPAMADATLVRQVLVNLLSNAIKFTATKPQSQIEFGYVTVGEGDGPHLPERPFGCFAQMGTVPFSATGGEGAYYAKDNGVGFDMQYAHKLFGVFQRLHAATEFEGTGVGLALVERIITRHDGRVWAEGAIDQGATFYFTLPTGERR